MLQNFLLSIVKVEGLGDINKCNCSLSLENKPNSVCSLTSLPINFPVSSNGLITITILDKDTSTAIASISFHSDIFSNEWFYWLPLNLGIENYLASLPSTITLPRMLIGVNKEMLQLSLQEISETSDTFEDESTILENTSLQHPNSQKSFTFTESLLSPTHSSANRLEHYRSIIKSLENELIIQKTAYQEKCKDFQLQIEKCKQEVELERRYRIDMQEKFEHCASLYETVRRREENFIRMISKRPKVWMQIEAGEGVTVSAGKGLKVMPEDLKELTREGLKCLPERWRAESSKSFFNDTSVVIGGVEKRVKEVLQRLKLEGLMKKSRDVNYLVGGKSITLCLKQGEVCCKNGVALDSYLFKYCKSEIEDFIRNRTNKKSKSPNRSPVCNSRTPGLYTQRISRY